MIAATFRLDNFVRKNDVAEQGEYPKWQYLDDSEAVGKFLDKYDKYLVYRETGAKTGKPHFQGIIWVADDKAFSAMKVRFSTTFKSHERHQKSMALAKKDTYEVYICKDGDKAFSKGYTDEDIAELQSKSYKKVEKKKSSNFGNAYDYCISHGVTLGATANGWKIVEVLLEYYREHCKCEPTDFQLANMAKSICKQVIYEHAVKTDKMYIYERYLRDRAKSVLGSSWTTPVL